MEVSGPGAGILRQGLPTEARIEAPQPQDEARDRSAPLDEVDVSQASRNLRSATPPQTITPPADTRHRVDITA